MKKAIILALAVVLGMASLAQAGAIPGPRERTTVVRALSTDVYHIPFRGGELAAITIRGDGDSDLNVRVVDAFGQQVLRTVGRGDKFTVTFRPAVNMEYRIEVINSGVANLYTLRTN
jgi:hypothetical protein